MTTTEREDCVGRTRDDRACTARASAVIYTPADGVLHVCGNHRIAYHEANREHGPHVAAVRVLTGRRPSTTDRN